MVTPSCFVRGVNTQKARRNLIDHSTPPQTFSFLIGLGKTEKKGLDQHYKKYTPCLGIDRGSSLFIGISYGADPKL